jgi:N-acetyl-anhydromuramyl-L-alanine amidase AmpD
MIRGLMVAKYSSILTLSLAGLVSLSACASNAPSPGEELGSSEEAIAFQRAAEDAGVSRDLLVAIAAVEGGLGMPAHRDVAEDVEVPAAGPLMLRRGRRDTLALGAQLTGQSEWVLRRETDLALGAAAKVLARLEEETQANPADLASHLDALKELSGYADEGHRTEYAHRVFAQLARGGTFEGRDGKTVVLPKHDLPPSLTLDISFQVRIQAGVEYPGAEYFPIPAAKRSEKMMVGRDGFKVNFVIVHDTEGGWDGSVATLQNDPGKSVQYIIGTDGRIGQFMSEADTGWHSGNGNYNRRSVGIEHVGYATRPFPTKQYEVSAKMVKHLAAKYTLPLDRAHIIGHDQVPNGNRIAASSAPCADSPKACQTNLSYGGASKHTDPGIWEWARLMYLTGGTAKANDVTPIWNCSSDKGFAFRQVAGKVEVVECTSCEVKPTGVDDVCTPKPVTPPPPAPTTEPPPNVEPTKPPAAQEPPPAPPAPTPPPPPAESGCAASGDSLAHASSSLVSHALLALAVILGLRAMRRRTAVG